MIKTRIPQLIVLAAICAYVLFFSYASIARLNKLHASYYDVGIMNQTVHNSYMVLRTGDFGRILELTSVEGTQQIKRMAIHNDIFLAFLAPFYFLHDGPETLLVLQSFGLALGAWFVFLSAQKILKGYPYISAVFALAYLMHPALQRINMYEFHAVAFAAPLLLAMILFWLEKRYVLSFVCAVLACFTKEQVAMVTGVFAVVQVILHGYGGLSRGGASLGTKREGRANESSWSLLDVYGLQIVSSSLPSLLSRVTHIQKYIIGKSKFAVALFSFSVVWFFVSFFVIIPYFRGGAHFTAERYGEPGKYLFTLSTLEYIGQLVGPFGFFPLAAPAVLLVALPEFAVNLLSESLNMRNIYFHYTAVIVPIISVAAVYGFRNLATFLTTRFRLPAVKVQTGLLVVLAGAVGFYSYALSPLPYSKLSTINLDLQYSTVLPIVRTWQEIIRDDSIKVSTTGHLAPFFTNRRYFYDFGSRYTEAEYVLVRDVTSEYSEEEDLKYWYFELQQDQTYTKVFDQQGVEVYKKQ